jgi:hypothetical protein
MSLRSAKYLFLAGLFGPTALSAQGNEQPPPQVQEWIMEMQQIQRQVQPVQQQALEDEALRQEQEEVTKALREAIVQADPSMAAKLDRMEELMSEARAAQAAQDQEKIVALTQEAQTLQSEISEAQAEALARPEVDAMVVAFRENLHERMIEIDPATQPLLERLEELDGLVKEAMEGGLAGV